MKKLLALAALGLSVSAFAQPHGGPMEGKGTMTKADFLAQAGKHFDLMDANKDGSISQDERKDGMREQMLKHKMMKEKMEPKTLDLRQDAPKPR